MARGKKRQEEVIEESDEDMEEESEEEDLQSDEEELSEDEEGDVEGENEEDEAGDAEEDEESDDEEYQRDLAALVAIEAAKMKKVESAKKAGVYDDEGLDLMTKSLCEDRAWIETLATTTRPVEDEDGQTGIADDLKREHNFKALASGAAVASIQRLDSLGVKYRRPLDYYAEMVKTDYHMDKVKDRLINEKEQIIGAEDRRKQRDAKKFGKQVQHKKELDKQAKKKEEFDKISKWKDTQKKAGKGAGDAELDELLSKQETKKEGSKRQRDGEDGGKGGGVNKKRAAADGKFGFGGKKRNAKRSTSTTDVKYDSSSQFMGGSKKEKKGKGGAKGKGGGKGGKAGGKRPGKSSRGKGGK